MIKINLEFGSLFGEGEPDTVKLTVINYDKQSTADAVARFPFLQKIAPDDFKSILNWINYTYDQCYKGTITGKGTQYAWPIANGIREKYGLTPISNYCKVNCGEHVYYGDKCDLCGKVKDE